MTSAGNMLMLSGGKKWRNPYVTDGLVAMYDGEWNVAPYEHGSDVTVWKDLVGNNDLDIDASKCSWADTYISATAVNAVDDHFAEKANSSFGENDIWAIEMVAYFNGETLNSSFLVDVGVDTRGVVNRYDNLYTAYARSAKVLDKDVYDKRWRSLSVCYTAIGTTAITYKNGSPTNMGTMTTTGGAVTCGHLALSRMRTNTRIASIRLYSRALSADEIAANYAVDVARFNLPTS